MKNQHEHEFNSDGGCCIYCNKTITELLMEDNPNYMKNTITTTSQATTNFLNAADRIMDLMDDLEFSSARKQDPEFIRHTVAQIIRESMQGNVNYGYEEDGEPLGIPHNGREENSCDCKCGCQDKRQSRE